MKYKILNYNGNISMSKCYHLLEDESGKKIKVNLNSILCGVEGLDSSHLRTDDEWEDWEDKVVREMIGKEIIINDLVTPDIIHSTSGKVKLL